MFKKIIFSLFFVSLVTGRWSLVFSAEAIPMDLQKIGIVEKAGANVPLGLTFADEAGNPVALKDFFDGTKPVVLNLVYFSCPSLCTLALNGLVEGLQKTSWSAGEEFRVVTVSIDPSETPALAAEKKGGYLKEYGRKGAESGWHFLTGRQTEINQLADAVGFHYVYDPEQKQYVHAAGIFVLSPEGELVRTLYGSHFNPRDLKLALMEATKGRMGNIVDRLLMPLYGYDPITRKYSLKAGKF